MRVINQLIQRDVPLAPYNTFHIGGKAKLFARTSNSAELIDLINWTKKMDIDYKIFAGGSNVIFPDEGLDCFVICLLGGKIILEDVTARVDAGVLLSDVINETIGLGLSGLESLSGIPGTTGGAIVGNAGAYGHEISEVVDEVEVWDGQEKLILSKAQCEFGYRESIFKQKSFVLLSCILSFVKSENQNLADYSNKVIKMREKKYKPGLKCPGSFFKNILEKDLTAEQFSKINRSKIIYGKLPAGYLLEQVGAKGMRVGDIEIAAFHGNLFINSGNGKAADVKKLAFILKEKVMKRFGIMLEEEIRYF